MILTVTLNFAVDVTYRLPRAQLGAHNRVSLVGRRAGGKGVNVARVLRGLGREVVVTGLAGLAVGAAARADLARSGLADETITIGDESRVTHVLVEDSGEVTGFSELGPQVTPAEWTRLLERFDSLATHAEAVVLSGSLPPGVPADAYAQLIARTDLPTLLDSHGEPLAHGIDARPALVKINADELADYAPGTSVLEGAARLLHAGAGAAVISQGHKGLLALTSDGAWSAAPPEVVTGNPTGAGDAASAALVVGMLEQTDWPARLADAVALSAAAVAAPQAGSFDPDTYRRLRDQVCVEELQTSS